MYSFQKKRSETRRYFPVAAILAAVATLILLLIIFTSRNLSLARQRLEDSLLQEGLTLSRAIEAGSRTGMRMSWSLNHLQTLVEEIGNAPKVAYISVIGTDGNVLAHTQEDRIGESAGIDMQVFKEMPSTILTRTTSSEEGADLFEIIAGITARDDSDFKTFSGGMGRGKTMRMMRENAGGHHGFADLAVIQLGMKMTELKQVQQRDMRNAILMFIVLSVLGSAALYFIVFMQNYYAINHAFQTMKSYTQHVVDSMANGLISLDTQRKIVTMNRQAHQILDIPQHEPVQGKALTDILDLHDDTLFQILAGGEPIIEQERTCTTHSQKTLSLSLSASTLSDDEGKQLGTVLLFRDLSDVKALQEQIKRAERLASLGKLAAGVAHEIRNPLGSIKGFLQYFQRKLDLRGQDKTYLTVMVNEIDRLNSVISNLLDFARPKEAVFELCNIEDLIRHVLTLIEGDLQTKQLEVSLDIKEAFPQIRVDCDQITQVLLNILLNAIQMTEAGGQIHINVDIQRETRQLELTITDNGKGIASDNLPKIFDPFFSTKKQGSGLGLAIAYAIVKNHHGDIRVESEEGKGSSFRIRLPV